MQRHFKFILVAVFFGLAVFPMISTAPTYLRIGSIFFITLIALTGLHIITGLTKVVSLCHAALMGVGAYGSALTAMAFGAPSLVAICAGVAAAAIVALLLAVLTGRLEDHYLALATLGAAEILTNVFRGSTEITGGTNGLSGVPPLSLFGLILDTPQKYYPFCLVLAVVSVYLAWKFDQGIAGRSLRAIGDEGILAEAFGANGRWLRSVAFVLSGAFAGLAGALSAHVDGFVGPESFGVGISIAYLCFLVIGGLGSVTGVVLGAALASLGLELFRGFAEWQMVIVAFLSLGILVLRSMRTDGKWSTKLS